jgi:type II secretory pathway pseudopilin PulG
MNTQSQNTPRRTRRARRGLSMIEAMIAMGISSMLLVAVSGAFSASAQAVETNDQFFRASQTARVLMHQMLGEIRRADLIRCDDAGDTSYFDVMRPAEDITPLEVYRRYQYDSNTRQLTLTIYKAGDVVSARYVLANNIEAAAFGPPPPKGSNANNVLVVQRLPVTVSVKVGSNFITLNGAAGPRRALK